RRRSAHLRIAQALQEDKSIGVAALPELLAYHFMTGGNYAAAIDCFLEAGRNARLRSAQAEAIHHYDTIAELLEKIPEDEAYPREEKELAMYAALASCRAAVDGYSADSARDAYQRAEELAGSLRNQPMLFKARYGLEAYYMMRGDFSRALTLAQSCQAMAERAYQSLAAGPKNAAHDAYVITLAQAYWVTGSLLFHQGEFAQAMSQMDYCKQLCEPVPPEHRRKTQDPGVMCQVYQAWYAWESGNPDRAIDRVEQAVRDARSSGLAYSLGVALGFDACIHFFRREYSECLTRASEAISVCAEPGYLTWLAWAKVLRGRALAESAEQRTRGIAEIIDGLRLWDDTGAIVTRPFALALLAEAYSLDEQRDEALRCIELARQTVDEYGERYYEAEIDRLRGNFILANAEAGDADAAHRAEQSYQSAIAFARARGMRSSLLRATTDLGRLRAQRGAKDQAIADLEAALAPFAEGLATGDLIAARGLLTQIKRDAAGIRGNCA
ncbi:MAG: hypothetical protein ACR2QB_07835, partial [Gammaproteobacteria bacterium]